MKFRERLVPWSQDPRLPTKEKLRNRSALKRMTPEFCLLLGLMADLSSMVFSLLRRFDVDWHDPAHCQVEKAEFAGRRAAQPSYFVTLTALALV